MIADDGSWWEVQVFSQSFSLFVICKTFMKNYSTLVYTNKVFEIGIKVEVKRIWIVRGLILNSWSHWVKTCHVKRIKKNVQSRKSLNIECSYASPCYGQFCPSIKGFRVARCMKEIGFNFYAAVQWCQCTNSCSKINHHKSVQQWKMPDEIWICEQFHFGLS